MQLLIQNVKCIFQWKIAKISKNFSVFFLLYALNYEATHADRVGDAKIDGLFLVSLRRDFLATEKTLGLC